MNLKIMGKKRGMTQVFDESGTLIVCTVVKVEPNVVTQIKTDEKDGYNALQLGFEKITTKDERTISKRCTKPLSGHYAKSSIAPRKHLLESKIDKSEEYAIGNEYGVECFAGMNFIDVQGVSKGKGFSGGMKKFGYRGGPASHGASKFHRKLGSTGMRSTPGRCLPGGKRASQLGNKWVTIQSQKIFKVDQEKGLILIKGQVPGATNALVVLSKACKRS